MILFYSLSIHSNYSRPGPPKSKLVALSRWPCQKATDNLRTRYPRLYRRGPWYKAFTRRICRLLPACPPHGHPTIYIKREAFGWFSIWGVRLGEAYRLYLGWFQWRWHFESDGYNLPDQLFVQGGSGPQTNTRCRRSGLFRWCQPSRCYVSDKLPLPRRSRARLLRIQKTQYQRAVHRLPLFIWIKKLWF